jgi:hypothetical protein
MAYVHETQMHTCLLTAYLLLTDTLDAFRVCMHGDAAALQMDTID